MYYKSDCLAIIRGRLMASTTDAYEENQAVN